jgi:energy-converting hydrogenase Eha subunit H
VEVFIFHWLLLWGEQRVSKPFKAACNGVLMTSTSSSLSSLSDSHRTSSLITSIVIIQIFIIPDAGTMPVYAKGLTSFRATLTEDFFQQPREAWP